MPEFIVNYDVLENGKSVLEGNTVIFSHSYDPAYLHEAIKKELIEMDTPLQPTQTIRINNYMEM